MRKLFLTALVFFLIFNLGCVKPVVVNGTAMLPAYSEGDRVMLDTNFGELKRGDVISFLYPINQQQWFIKRIIGLPNETIEIKDGVVFVEGRQLDEPYLAPAMNQGKSILPLVKVNNDNYFVLGDNRDNSSDSRLWGTVPKELVKGVVWFKYANGDKK